MNNADRKIFTDLFTAITEALDAPCPRDYADLEKQNRRILDMASAARTYLKGDVRDGLDPAGLRSTIACLHRLIAEPLDYEPETPEQAERCGNCKGKRRWHHDDGGIEATSYSAGCPGFTTTTTKGNAA